MASVADESASTFTDTGARESAPELGIPALASRSMPSLKLPPQVVGNVGLYYVCYELSRRGWNVIPTARNARGVDLLIYSQDARRMHTIQIKALSKSHAVPLGSHLDHLFADFIVICRNIARRQPECFVLLPDEVRMLVQRNEKAGKHSYWLEPARYASDEFREAWDRIGVGAATVLPSAP